MFRFGVTDKKELELFQRMERLGIFERDLKESFIKGSGKGGQKLNKSNSCVQLTHTPSGLEVRSQKERSQSLNRFFARRALCDLIERKLLGDSAPAAIEAARKRKNRERRAQRARKKVR